MDFPSWIDKTRDDKKRAQLRLKHMLSIATLRKFGKASMHRLSKEVGCDHSSIFNAIDRGWFTPQMAADIERVFGRAELPSEALVFPLNVQTSGGQNE